MRKQERYTDLLFAAQVLGIRTVHDPGLLHCQVDLARTRMNAVQRFFFNLRVERLKVREASGRMW